MINYYGNTITWVPQLNKSNKALYLQIAECIEKDIERGILKTGYKLPPQRVIANYLDINHSTVTRAYKLCEERGLIKGVIGSGTFVTSSAGIPNNVLSVETNTIIEMGSALPLYSINKQIEANIRKFNELIDYEMILKYCPPEGLMKHRYIASKWLSNFGINATADNVLISSGSQNALATIFMGVFTRGDRVATDTFTYTGVKNLASLLGIILVPIKSDKSGMCPVNLEKKCKSNDLKGVYLIPDCHNPTSITMPLSRRREMSKIIRENNLILIEDGTFSFIEEHVNTPITSMIPDQCFYVHGTSKALSPSLRISYIVAPKEYLKKLSHVLNNLTWMASPMTAELVSLFIKTSMYEEIIKLKRAELKKRNVIFDELMKGYETIDSAYSMYRYLILPTDYDDLSIEKMCYERGVQVFSAKRFSISTNLEYNALRISISAPINRDDMIKGLEIIKDVIDNYKYYSSIIF